MDDLLSTITSAVGSKSALGAKPSEQELLRGMLNSEQLPTPTWKLNWQGQPIQAGTGNIQTSAQQAQQPTQNSQVITSGFNADDVINAIKNSAVTANEMKQPAQASPTTPQPNPHNSSNFTNNLKGAGEFIANQVTGLGATAIGGLKGISELVQGHGIDAATNAVNNTQDSLTYVPKTDMGKKIQDVASSPLNPMNYPSEAGDYLGDKTLELTGSPALATAVNTGVNALPLLFLKKGGKAIAEKPLLTQDATIKSTNTTIPSAEKPPNLNTVQPEFQESAPVAYEGKKLPLDEQNKRADTLKRIGLNDARQSAIEGDNKTAATEYQQSKLDNVSGNYMRSVLDSERNALETHADNIVKDTGGTSGLDESAKYSRGQTILTPMDKLKTYFDDSINNLYEKAHERAAGVPVDMPSLHQAIGGDQADFLGTTQGESLLKGVNARMKSLGMIDDNGNPAQVTVKQAERLKQYLGQQWQPITSRLIANLKDSIDEDVTKSAGEDIYQQARKTRYERAKTLDDPNGIAKVMDSSGPNGINRKVNIEKIPDEITGLPVDQLAHIIKTLKDIPPEILPYSMQAINEIKAHFANKIHQAGSQRVGQWGARDVNKYLNNNAEKLKIVFNQDELNKIRDLNDAGNILKKDQSYPGAAVQEHNLIKSGTMGALRGGGAAIGSIAGPVGAAVGGYVGDVAARKFSDASSLKATQKKMTKLSNFPK